MAKKAKKAVEKKPEEKQFAVSLAPLYNNPRKKRANRAIVFLKSFVFKHFRISAENVKVSNALNEAIWGKGREHIPRKIEITVVKQEGKANIYLKGEKIEKPKEKEEEKKGKGKAAAKPETEEAKAEKEETERKKEEKKAKEKAAELTGIKRGTAKGSK